MPNYDYKCKSCNRVVEHYYRLNMMPDRVVCSCGTEMKRLIGQKVTVSGDLEPFVTDNISGENILVKSKLN